MNKASCAVSKTARSSVAGTRDSRGRSLSAPTEPEEGSAGKTRACLSARALTNPYELLHEGSEREGKKEQNDKIPHTNTRESAQEALSEATERS